MKIKVLNHIFSNISMIFLNFTLIFTLCFASAYSSPPVFSAFEGKVRNGWHWCNTTERYFDAETFYFNCSLGREQLYRLGRKSFCWTNKKCIVKRARTLILSYFVVADECFSSSLFPYICEPSWASRVWKSSHHLQKKKICLLEMPWALWNNGGLPLKIFG